MMKFFRKYTKHMIASVMGLLLIAWLVGDPLMTMMKGDYSPAKIVRGEVFGESVQVRDMQSAYDEARTLDALIPRWRYPWMHMLRSMGMKEQAAVQTAMQIRSDPLSDDEWYMLDAEARRSHINIPPEAVERFKTNLRLTADHLNMLRHDLKKSLEDIDRALQSYLRVQEALLLASSSFKVSEADVRDTIRQTTERAKAVAILVEAKPFIDEKYEPTEDELKEHFEKFKNAASKPADSGDYGYQIPDQVKLEYIRVNMPPLVARQSVTDEETYSYWSGHKNDFHKPSTQPAGTNPATQPEEKPQSYATFTEARPKVREKLLNDKAKGDALRIAREVISLLQQPWATAPATQPDNLKQPPESQLQPDVYEKLIAQLEPKYPGVLRFGRTDWVDQNGINKIPDFTRMASGAGTQQEVRLMEVAFLAPGLDPKLQDNPHRSRFVRNLYETAPEPFVNPNGDAIVARTIAVQPQHPPAGIDEIRQRLVDDVRKVRAFNAAQQKAQDISQRAAGIGLEKLWNDDPTLKEKLGEDGLRHPQPFARMQIYNFGSGPEMYPASVPGLGYDDQLSKIIFDMANTRTATQPAPLLVRVQAENQRFMVIQFLDILPVTREEYEKERPRVLQLVQSQQQVDLLTNWFNPDQIRQRVGWKDANPSEPEEAPAETAQKS